MGRCRRKVKTPFFFFFYFKLCNRSVFSEEDKPAVQENPQNLTVVLLLSLIAYRGESYAGTVVDTFLIRAAHDAKTRLSVFLSIEVFPDDWRTLSCC